MSSLNRNADDAGSGAGTSTSIGRPPTSTTSGPLRHQHQPLVATAAALRGASLAFGKPKSTPPPPPSSSTVAKAVSSRRRDNGALVAATSASAGSSNRNRPRSPAPPPAQRQLVPPLGTGNSAAESPDGPSAATTTTTTTTGVSASSVAALVAAGGAFLPQLPAQNTGRSGGGDLASSSSVIAATLAASRAPSPSPVARSSGNSRSRTPGLPGLTAMDAGAVSTAGPGTPFRASPAKRRGSFTSIASGASAASLVSKKSGSQALDSMPPSTMSIVSLFEGKSTEVDLEKRMRRTAGNSTADSTRLGAVATPQLHIDTRRGATPSPSIISNRSSSTEVLSPKPRRPGSKPRLPFLLPPNSLSHESAGRGEVNQTLTNNRSRQSTPHSSTKSAKLPPPPTPPKPRGVGGTAGPSTGWRHSSVSSRGGSATVLSRALTSSIEPSPGSSRPPTAMTTSSDDTFVSALSMRSPDLSPTMLPQGQGRQTHKSTGSIISQRHVSLRRAPSALSLPPRVLTPKTLKTSKTSKTSKTPKTSKSPRSPGSPRSPRSPRSPNSLKPMKSSKSLLLKKSAPPKLPPPRRRPTTPVNASLNPYSSLASVQTDSSTSPLTLNSLTNAILAGSLAASRLTPTDTGTTAQSSASGLSVFASPSTPARQRSPRLKETLRRPVETRSDDEDLRRLQRRRERNKPLRKRHAHHEGARKRWRDEITDRERRRYEALWASNRGLLLPSPSGSATGSATGAAADYVVDVVVRELWRRSRLPDDELAEVWSLVDREGRGLLGKVEFVVGTWFVDQRLKGRKIPSRVSESVWVSGGGRKFVGKKKY